jgi:hypothetical protein
MGSCFWRQGYRQVVGIKAEIDLSIRSEFAETDRSQLKQNHLKRTARMA